MVERTQAPTVTRDAGTADDFDDVEHELCTSTREVPAGYDPGAELDAFRATIRASHWRVDHHRLW